jgi:hypothetical protein
MKSRQFAAVAIASAAMLAPTVARAGTAQEANRAGLPAAGSGGCDVLDVHGAVGEPVNLTAQSLAALPTTTMTTARGTFTGVPLEYLVFTSTESPVGTPASSTLSAAAPGAATLALPNQTKNPLLAAVLTATGTDGKPLAVALGEVDQGFGNHPALLTGIGSGFPTLVFPGDLDDSRTVKDVYDVNVTVVDPATLDTPPQAGDPAAAGTSIVVRKNRGGATMQTLWKSQLDALPQVTLDVTFQAGGTTHDTEVGPSLRSVVNSLPFEPRRDTAVWATGSASSPGPGNASYSGAVTLAEDGTGGRPLLLATIEHTPGNPNATTTNTPRLVPDGDVKGGRYVSDAVTLTILDTGGEPVTDWRRCSGAPKQPGSQ